MLHPNHLRFLQVLPMMLQVMQRRKRRLLQQLYEYFACVFDPLFGSSDKQDRTKLGLQPDINRVDPRLTLSELLVNDQPNLPCT
jgi:hypothetical protein